MDHNKLSELIKVYFTGAISKFFAKNVPENGEFEGTNLGFNVYGMYISECRAAVEPDYVHPGVLRLKIGALVPESTKIMYAYVYQGTKQGLLEYISSQRGFDEIAEALIVLDENVRGLKK
jgi:hypothetical protein